MMKPRRARLAFRLRTLINSAIVLVIFVPLVFIFAQFPWAIFADLAAIGILFYLFFFVLEKRVIDIECPHCQKYVATNTPWKCGFCHQINRQIDKYPFNHQCEYCGTEPRAYECHHCSALIFLTKDELEQNYACRADLRVALPPKDISTERQEAKAALMHEIEMATLADRLKSIKKPPKAGKNDSPKNAIEESYIRYHANVMGAKEFAQRQKAVNAQKFKDDLDMLEQANATVDSWLRERL